MSIHAVFLNCTLKRSPEISNTEALIGKVVEWFDSMDVTSEVIRVVDHRIPTGVTSDEGEGDEWPKILERIKAADILVIGTPIWFGHRGSVAQLVIERLDGTYNERNDVGQYPLYNKVGGIVVTGNEDGAHSAAESTLFNLSHLGCTIPPNADTYWVGEAGPGPSYIEAGGESHPYTQRTTRWMAHNLVHLARMLKANPIPAEGNTFDEETEHQPHIG
ncbi:MAG: flavodoxin family protein [Actinobacteria bacterium]|nr:flavodoxin family protein [Actinomycetota bacterium]